MAVAGGNALMPSNGQRIVGSEDYVNGESGLACAYMHLRKPLGGIARVHKEDAGNTGQ